MTVYMIEMNYDDGRCSVDGIFSTADAAWDRIKLFEGEYDDDDRDCPVYSVSKWIVDDLRGRRLEP